VSRGTQEHRDCMARKRRLRGSHPLWHGVPAVSPDPATHAAICGALQPRTPAAAMLPPPPQSARPVWARPGSLATTTGISHLISFPRGTEMFQFPRCPAARLCIQRPLTTLARRRVAPFGFAWLIARLQLPRHVSPLSAPFLGSWPLGIHPTPVSAWLLLCASRRALHDTRHLPSIEHFLSKTTRSLRQN
jgi:hypothetical protein